MQLNECNTAPRFLQLNQNLTPDFLFLRVLNLKLFGFDIQKNFIRFRPGKNTEI